MKQIVGYLLGIAGIVVLALSFDSVQKAIRISMPGSLTANVLTAAGLILIGVSMVILVKSSKGQKVSEVPIYHGKEIVGYRRLEKK